MKSNACSDYHLVTSSKSWKISDIEAIYHNLFFTDVLIQQIFYVHHFCVFLCFWLSSVSSSFTLCVFELIHLTLSYAFFVDIQDFCAITIKVFSYMFCVIIKEFCIFSVTSSLISIVCLLTEMNWSLAILFFVASSTVVIKRAVTLFENEKWKCYFTIQSFFLKCWIMSSRDFWVLSFFLMLSWNIKMKSRMYWVIWVCEMIMFK